MRFRLTALLNRSKWTTNIMFFYSSSSFNTIIAIVIPTSASNMFSASVILNKIYKKFACIKIGVLVNKAILFIIIFQDCGKCKCALFAE